MSVCGEENGKEVNSKCGKIASSLIVRHTILGGIGVIQHVLKHDDDDEEAPVEAAGNRGRAVSFDESPMIESTRARTRSQGLPDQVAAARGPRAD